MSGDIGGQVLVTGGGGFIGGYIVRELASRGRDVCIYASGAPSSETQFVLGRDAGAVSSSAVRSRTCLDSSRWRGQSSTRGHHPRRPASSTRSPCFAEPVPGVPQKPPGHDQCLRGGPTLRRRTRRELLVDRGPADGAIPADRRRAPAPSGVAKAPGSGAYGAARRRPSCSRSPTSAFGLDVRTIRPSAVYGFGMRWHSANYMKQFVEPAVRGEAVRLRRRTAAP